MTLLRFNLLSLSPFFPFLLENLLYVESNFFFFFFMFSSFGFTLKFEFILLIPCFVSHEHFQIIINNKAFEIENNIYIDPL